MITIRDKLFSLTAQDVSNPQCCQEILDELEKSREKVLCMAQFVEQVCDLFPSMHNFELYGDGDDPLTTTQDRIVEIFSKAFHPVDGEPAQKRLHRKLSNRARKDAIFDEIAEKVRRKNIYFSCHKTDLILYLIRKRDAHTLKSLITNGLRIDIGPYDCLDLLIHHFTLEEQSALLGGFSILHHLLRMEKKPPDSWKHRTAGLCSKYIQMAFERFDPLALMCPPDKPNVFQAGLSEKDKTFRSPYCILEILLHFDDLESSESILHTIFKSTDQGTLKSLLSYVDKGERQTLEKLMQQPLSTISESQQEQPDDL